LHTDFFLYDNERKLAYRASLTPADRTNDQPVTGADLRQAVDAVLAGRAAQAEQIPSIGCNIKWKSGQEPEYFPA
jgi:hypothetical protein